MFKLKDKYNMYNHNLDLILNILFPILRGHLKFEIKWVEIPTHY